MPSAEKTPKVRRKLGYHHGNLRESVIAATLKLVAKRGPSGFTLAEAAGLAGVVPSALYRHFTNREELLAVIAHEGFDMLLQRLRAAVESSAGPHAAMPNLGVEYLRFALQHPSHFHVMFGAEIDRKEYPELLSASCRTLDFLLEISGTISSVPKDLATAIWSTIHGFSLLALSGEFAHTGLSTQPEETLRNGLISLIGRRHF